MRDNQVEEVKLKTDIVSVIGERVDIKKAGRNYKANCPFHGEKSASFMVSPELQIFKCFGCGEGGDVFTFLEKFEGMDFAEALKYLAEKAGVKLQNKNFGENDEKNKALEINNQIAKLYHYLLTTHPVGKKALEYLLTERGLKMQTIEEFGLGYSPEDPLIFKKFLLEKKKFNPLDLEKVGTALVRGNNVYDRFGGRVIFPLYDHRGNPIGFAGRILPWGRKDTAKYINSPDTILYHKSKVLYGLNVTRTHIKKKKIAIIVEGELDAISSYQSGIKNIVAIKGSALTEDQVRLLSRFADKFILALDSDMAGDAAARRGIEIAERLGIEVKVAKISKFKDPDEAARFDIDSYKSDLINAKGVWDYLIESVFLRFDASTGAGKAKISKALIPVIVGIEDKIVQSHYASLVAKKLDVSPEAVMGEVAREVKGEAPKAVEIVDKSTKKDRTEMLEDRLLTLAFQSDPTFLIDDGEVVLTQFNKKLVDEYRKFYGLNRQYSSNAFAEFLPAELLEGFSRVILVGGQNISDNPEDLKKELDLVKKELKIQRIKEQLKNLAVEMRDLEEKGEKEKLLKAQNKFTKLTKTLSGYEESEVGGIILMEP